MKRLIVIHKEMGYSGIETSILHLVDRMKSYFDVKVLTWKAAQRDKVLGDKLEIFDEKISSIYDIVEQDKKSIKTVGLMAKLKWIYYKLLVKFRLFNKMIVKRIARKKRQYIADVGICIAPWYTSFKLFESKVQCKYKVCFIHGDVSKVDVGYMEPHLRRFDKILCVSQSCAEVFKKVFPALQDKADYVYNFQDVDTILQKAKEREVEFGEKLNIISVARLSEEKAHLRTLAVMKALKEEGLDFCWHIVGSGYCEREIKEYIDTNGLADCCIMHGHQNNPYPYIKAADLFFLGSYHEAAPMVFAESMLLKVPVLTTNTCSAVELVGEKGFVCENSEEGIYEALKNLISNKELILLKKKRLENYEFDNIKIENKLKEILTNERS